MRVCCAVLLLVRCVAPLYAALHNACRATPHCAAHYTAPHALCCTALLCALRCTLCAVPHRTVCAVPHCTMMSPTPMPRARQHKVEDMVDLVPTANLRPVSSRGTMGVLHQLHPGRCACSAAAVARVSLQP